MATQGGDDEIDIVVTGGSEVKERFGAPLEAAKPAVSTEIVDPTEVPNDHLHSGTIDGIFVSGTLTNPDALIERFPKSIEVPILLVVEEGNRDTIEAALEAGADDYYLEATVRQHPDVLIDRVRTTDEPGTTQTTESDYREIFENVSDGLLIHDPDTGEICDANERFCEMHGYDRSNLIGTTVDLITAPDDAYSYEAAKTNIERAAEEGPQLFEWRNERADGETFPVEVHLSAVRIGDSERVLASVRDITERKRREREFEQIFNGVRDPIAVYEPTSLELLDANEAFLEMVGHEDIETLREAGLESHMVTEEGYTIEEAKQIHQRVSETGEPETFEWQGRTDGGDRIWLEVRVMPAVIKGEAVTIASHRDVTEQRTLQRRFRTIAERVDEIISLTTPDMSELLYVNPAYESVYGRPVDELYEDPTAYREAIHPEDSEIYAEEWDRMLEAIASGHPADSYEFSYRIQRPDGEIRWLETTAYPILDQDGDPYRLVALTDDVTERRRREATLETFHEATRELTTTESREAACHRATTAAEEVLGFPLVATHLYDEASGRLELVAATERLSELDAEPGSLGPGESLPWQVYVDGDPIINPDDGNAIFGPRAPSPAIILPLGTHGVMLVGGPTGEFDDEDIELARILAATLEAALNHVAGEAELEEREAELRRQRERARQLQRLNAIIRDIEQATVEESSRAGIERAVCERLTEVDANELVWMGEPTVDESGLLPRCSAGGNEPYMDALSGELEGGSTAHPAVGAYQAGEPRFIENVATEATSGGWRRTALRHGIQSVVAVPITHESTIHGVLTVASDEPAAFDEATREVLAELGRSIGYAVTVTERERALESEGTTELEFSVSDDGLFLVRAAIERDCSITLERTVRRSGGSFSTFYVVEDAPPASLVSVAEATPSVENAQVISEAEESLGGLVEVTGRSWFGAVFTDHGAVVREANADGSDGTLVVEAPQGTDVRTLVEAFQDRYPDAELVAQRQRERSVQSLFELRDALQDALSDRQFEALETAYSAGYFAWPRKTSGEEVAELLGVTQPTFNKHLRTAERRAFQVLLDQKQPESPR